MAVNTVWDYIGHPFVTKHLPFMQSLSNKLHKKTKIRFLSYIKLQDNGKYLHLSTEPDWVGQCAQKYNTASIYHPRIAIGYKYWDKIENKLISDMAHDAKTNFNIAAVIEFVYRDSFQDCYHLYSFCSGIKGISQAYQFYGLHKAQLLRIIANLNNKGYQYLNDAAEKDALTTVHNHKPIKHTTTHHQGHQDMILDRFFPNLSDYEMEIVILYASGGFSAKQIGCLLNKSQKTVEYHLSQIRDKTPLKDRKDMNAYVRAKGWDKLVNFYANLGSNSLS